MEAYKHESTREDESTVLSGYIFYYSLKLKARLESSADYSEKTYFKPDFIDKLLNPIIKYLKENKVPVRKPAHKYKSALQLTLANLIAVDDYLNSSASAFDATSDFISEATHATNVFNQIKEILYCTLHKKDINFEFEQYIDTSDENILSHFLYYLCAVVMYTHAELKLKNIATTLASEIMRVGIHAEDPEEEIDYDPYVLLSLIDSLSGGLNSYFNYEYRTSESLKENANRRAELKIKAQSASAEIIHQIAIA